MEPVGRRPRGSGPLGDVRKETETLFRHTDREQPAVQEIFNRRSPSGRPVKIRGPA